ncbi:MAG: J domain-containing protein [Acidiferrobacteraceae bacterium]
MTIPLFPTVLVEPMGASAPLTKAQKQFNTLVRKINILKTQLVEWRDTVPRRAQQLSAEYGPLHDTYNTLRGEFVQTLDHLCADHRITRNERAKLGHLITSIAAELVSNGHDDIKTLHDKYSDVGYDKQREAFGNVMKTMMEDVFGFEIGDDVDMNDPERLHEFMAQKTREEHANIQERQRHAEARRARRKKSAKQIEKEQQQKTESMNVRKSLQEVYRKLAAALHPDRVQDDAERDRKTVLMQRVNVAYGQKDLLQLLELQLETEHVDTMHAGALAEKRLQYYNRILKEQCAELQRALGEAQLPFRMELDIPPLAPLSAGLVMARMERDLADLRDSVRALQHDMLTFRDVKRLKAWLRDYKIPKEPGINDFLDLLSGVTAPFEDK